jgi:DNA-binding NarL/FixJ family response regulator
MLTRSEREILRLVADGLTNDEIGERVYLSGPTVQKRLHSVMTKLGVATRTQAVAAALRRRIA